jgi:hypothetical protein
MYAHHESRILDESAKYSAVGNPSARSQPAPGASSEGNVDPGATSGKDTKHEKGMTTGSSTRSGADKGGARNPSDDNKGDAGDSSDQVGVGPKNTGKMH